MVSKSNYWLNNANTFNKLNIYVPALSPNVQYAVKHLAILTMKVIEQMTSLSLLALFLFFGDRKVDPLQRKDLWKNCYPCLFFKKRGTSL